MADIVNSLFGVDLAALQRQQDEEGQVSTATIAGLSDPRAMLVAQAGNQGAQIGAGLAKLFGGQNEVVAHQQKVNDMLKNVQNSLTPEQLDDPVELHKAIIKGALDNNMPEVASQAYDALQAANLNQAKIGSENATANKANQEYLVKQNELQQNQKAQQAVAAKFTDNQNKGLPPPTNEEILGIVSQYVPAKDTFDKLTTSADKAAYREFAMQQSKDTSDARIEAAKQRGADTIQLAMLVQQGRMDLARLTASLKTDNTPNYKTYDTLAEKINDPAYGVAIGKIPAKEQTIGRRISIDSHEISQGIDQVMHLTKGGTINIAGTPYANIKTNGFLNATGVGISNLISPKDSQLYDAILYPLVKATMLFSNPDYRPTEADVQNGMKSYKANAGQPHEVQLAKLAELKKNYSAAAEGILDSHILNSAQAKSLKAQLVAAQKAIPWDVNDVSDYLHSGQAKKITLNTYLNNKGKVAPASVAGPTSDNITRLKSNPKEANLFDAQFGVGASAKVLGGK